MNRLLPVSPEPSRIDPSAKAQRWSSILAAVLVAGSSPGCDDATSPVPSSTLNGQTIATTHFHGTAPDMTTVFGPVNVVVGPAVELHDFGAVFFELGQPAQGFVDIDFSDVNVLIVATKDQPFGYFEVLRFADANQTIPPFAAVAINPVTDWPGLEAADVFVADDYFQINLTALQGREGERISLDVTLGIAGE